MSRLVKELTELKEKLESKKSERDEIKGKLSNYMQQLKDAGFDSIEAAEKYVNEKTAELEKEQDRLDEQVQKLSERVNEYQ